MKRTPFSFINKDGMRVKGLIFDPPAGKVNKTGVIYLPGSILGITAVHRLGVDIACEFQAAGFPVLLFAHSRIGESEGELSSGSGEKFGNLIKNGGFVDDTREAVAAFCSARLLDDVILVGHCGGALTALYTAEKYDHVKKVILISPPLTGEILEEETVTKGQSKEFLALYKRKLFSWEAWKRLLAGQSDYRQIGRIIKSKIPGRLRTAKTIGPNINHRFIRGLESVGKTIDVRIIYGDRDPGIEEFQSYQEQFARWNVRSRIFPDTSHGFVTAESMRLLMDELLV